MFKNSAQRAKLFELMKQHSLGQAPPAAPLSGMSHTPAIPMIPAPASLSPLPPMHTTPTITPQTTTISPASMPVIKNNFSRLNSIIKPIKAKAPKPLRSPKV